MATVEFECADHGIVDRDECDHELHHGHCPKCGMPLGATIGGASKDTDKDSQEEI